MKSKLYDFIFYLDCKFDGVDYTTRRKPKWLQSILWKLREMFV